jgi:demethylmenaquinone methyltransferase/2-methoxy-6-polyprenyl-1,4-benzoquinol methylase
MSADAKAVRPPDKTAARPSDKTVRPPDKTAASRVPLAPDKSPDRIAGMFDAIAPRYDLLNRLLSAGIDRRWRMRAIDALALTGRETVIDVCAGTADVALEARAPRRGSARAGRVVAVDFAGAMLSLGLEKVRAAGEARAIALVRGDAMQLPVADASADAVTIAFGIRNVQTASRACAEMARVLKPGGRLAILEFGVPRVPGLGGLYRWYFKAVLPRVGRLISGHNAAYSYLPASVGTFTPPEEFARMLEEAGFTAVEADPLTIGIVYLYTARRV